MRKTHHRTQAFFVISQLIETPAQFVGQEIKRGVEAVVKVLLAQLFPQMLNGVDFWAVGGLLDQANVAWDDQLSGAMPPGLIDLHHDEIVRESLAEVLQEETHRRRVRGRQNQGDEPSERSAKAAKTDIDSRTIWAGTEGRMPGGAQHRLGREIRPECPSSFLGSTRALEMMSQR